MSVTCFSGNDDPRGQAANLSSSFGNSYGVQWKIATAFEATKQVWRKQVAFDITWNATDFVAVSFDPRGILAPSGLSSLPFYLTLVGGDVLKRVDSHVVFIRKSLRFDPRSAGSPMNLEDNSTRWRFTLKAPYLNNSLQYRISLLGDNEKSDCRRSLSLENRTMTVVCDNDSQQGIRMGEELEIVLYSFPSDIPFPLFKLLVGYFDLFSSTRANYIVRTCCSNIVNILLVFGTLIVSLQIIALDRVHDRTTKNVVTVVGILAHILLFCPCVSFVSNVQETVALLYMFHLDPVPWTSGENWFLCVAWLLYPSAMCVLGLIPSVMFLADIKRYGHFHCCLTPKNCPPTCPEHKSQRSSASKDDKLETGEKSLTNPVVCAREEPLRPQVNFRAIVGEVVWLANWTVLLLPVSIHCIYCIVQGLFPLYYVFCVGLLVFVVEILVLWGIKQKW